ncbi:hypothetical protein [Photobacterium kagoshimensis]|uniref:hypothetical protein n=1 Tax=Photobacterium kagoshimensis TaxID=2910242 RepID=UPI003D0E540F
MDNFVWHDFGVLADVSTTDTMVLITNAEDQTRKMSITKYKETALGVFKKALTMKGKAVTVRTSQNTNNWSTSEWFSDLELAQKSSYHNDCLTIGESEPKPDQLF